MGEAALRPNERVKLLKADSSDDGSHDDERTSKSKLKRHVAALQINEQYAKRFEHNRKRDELFRLEEKYGKRKPNKTSRGSESGSIIDSTSEDEDEGDLATRDVDDQIQATLEAIRQKDPNIYNHSHTFYRQQEVARDPQTISSSSKPLHLQAYHRQNLLHGDQDEKHASQLKPSYTDEQSALKQELMKQMHRSIEDQSEGSDSDEGFLRAKAPRVSTTEPTRDLPSVVDADGDPEAFLSNLMASRAWVPDERSQPHPFESDDDEEEDEADRFEEAYNMRFEDPERANETLRSHSRKAAEQHSVRRSDLKGRKKARDLERLRKEAEKHEEEEEKARLRNLQIEQVHKKLEQLKDAAGMRDAQIPIEEWSTFLEAAFDSEKWDEEFQKRFGEKYYAQRDHYKPYDDIDASASRPDEKDKPQWADDIDIEDIVPGFEKEQTDQFSLSEDESLLPDEAGKNHSSNKKHSNRERQKESHAEEKRRSRKEHRKIEEMVDASLALDPASTTKSTSKAGFRYRASSPTSFGMSARDILLADDRDLNQHHGLKKLASFRDSSRKERDKQKLDKKRLQKWRRETFGDRQGPTSTFQDYVKKKLDPENTGAEQVRVQPALGDNETVKKKRKRSKKASQNGSEVKA